MPAPHRLLVFAAAAVMAVAPLSAHAGLFGTQEIRSSDLSSFNKWTGMLGRLAGDLQAAEECDAGVFSSCPVGDWRAFLDEIEGLTLSAQIRRVHRYMNEHPYVLDRVNWGVADYWATPPEFLNHDGDCEDFAIAKYFSLKRLGVPAARMRVVVVFDKNVGEKHAVLALRTPGVDGGFLILDNQIGEVLPSNQIRHYRPIYSINERAVWSHL